jgi:hypothetical protein
VDWIRERLREEGFETFRDLKSLKEKDIRDLADSYGRRTVADGRFAYLWDSQGQEPHRYDSLGPGLR